MKLREYKTRSVRAVVSGGGKRPRSQISLGSKECGNGRKEGKGPKCFGAGPLVRVVPRSTVLGSLG